MHASHVDPRLLIAAFAALVLAVLVALAPSLPVIELSPSGGDSAAPGIAAPAAQPGTTPGDPRWVTAPLRPPAF